MTRIAMIVLHDMAWDRRVDRAASALAEAGHEVAVFCLRGDDLQVTEPRNGYAIQRVATSATAPWSRPIAKIAASRRRERELTEAVAAWGPSIVHCHDLPAMRPGLKAASRVGARVVYDDHELFPDSLSQHKWRGLPPVVAYWRWVERACVPRAVAVITVSPGLADILNERYDCGAIVVPNVPEELLPPCEGSRLRDEYGIGPDVPVVLYQGLLLEVGRSLGELVESMQFVPGAVLVVQGTGPGEGAMRAKVSALGLEDRVVFTGWLPTDELYSYTCGATVGTVFHDGVTLSHKHAWPNRLFLYMMAGVPMAVADLPGLALIAREEGVGVTATPRDPHSMAAAINWLIEHPKERALMVDRGRAAAESTYNWDVQKTKLLDLYAGLTGAPTSEIT
ncbi:MAG: glycosyltransferase family 4 protein [Coriobacteriia bacterium]|nr:glycosyltransferase family 4 protein [Coriobacteriia bacterium]